jgi:hypothetical protein
VIGGAGLLERHLDGAISRDHRAAANSLELFRGFEELEVLADRHLRYPEAILEVGDAHPAVDLDGPPDRVVSQGGLESDRVSGFLHR